MGARELIGFLRLFCPRAQDLGYRQLRISGTRVLKDGGRREQDVTFPVARFAEAGKRAASIGAVQLSGEESMSGWLIAALVVAWVLAGALAAALIRCVQQYGKALVRLDELHG